MKGFRKFLIFLLFFALLCTATFCLFANALTDMARNAAGLGGNRTYALCAAGADGRDYALRLTPKGYALRSVGEDGKAKEVALRHGLPEEFEIADISVSSSGTVLLGGYSKEGVMPVEYRLFASADGGKTNLPLAGVPCRGSSAPEARRSAWRSGADETADGRLRFFLYENGECKAYEYDPAQPQGITQLARFNAGGAVAGAYAGEWMVTAQKDGSIAAHDGYGASKTLLGPGAYRMDKMFAAAGGCAFVDLASGRLVRIDQSGALSEGSAIEGVPGGGARLLYPGAGEAFSPTGGLSGAACLYVGADGRVLALVGDDGLFRVEPDGTVRDLTPNLNATPWQSALALAGILAAELIAAYGFCYLACEANGMFFPLALRGFLLLSLMSFWLVSGLFRFAVAPGYLGGIRQSALDSLLLYARGVEADADAEDAAAGLAKLRADFADVTVTLADGSDFGGVARSASAVVTPVEGCVAQSNGAIWYQAAAARGESAVVVRVNATALEASAKERLMQMALYCYAGALLVCLTATAALNSAAKGARRVRRGVDLLGAGNADVRVVNASGDELEALASAFNDLAGALNKGAAKEGERSEAYLRFVPSQLLTLLGAKGIEDVNKSKSASVPLAMMVVRFRFPQSVYQSDDKTLFENINGVFERIGGVVTKAGGAIYNFTYDGFDAVFEKGPLAAVSAAVLIRQETLELNAERAAGGGQPVELRVAVDYGVAMLGVVGDRDRVVPTVASACLSTARDLVELAGLLGANILCTTPVAEAAEEYRVRYIGKRRGGDGLMRVYEVTDGDDYAVRLAKDSLRDRFTSGIYAIYGGDFSAAKRIFMDIARSQAGDGVARHYLYLADAYEKLPPDEISL